MILDAVEEKIKEVMGDKTGAIAFNADLYKEINGQNKTKIPFHLYLYISPDFLKPVYTFHFDT